MGLPKGYSNLNASVRIDDIQEHHENYGQKVSKEENKTLNDEDGWENESGLW